jgi:hypothetical protein
MRSQSFVCAALAAFALVVPAHSADDSIKVVWGGGKQGTSAYTDAYVPAVIKVLDSIHMTGYHWGGESQGTIANAESVTNNPTHLAVGQLDILSLIQGKPIPSQTGKNYSFTILQKNLGPECLYLVINDKTYKTFGDVLGNAWQLSLVTGGEKSGSFGTWQVLAATYPDDLKDMTVAHVGSNDDIIKAVKSQKDTVGFFVMRPDPNSAIFKSIKDADLTLVPVVDFEIEGKYDFKNMKVSHGLFGGNYLTTACTSVALITGDPANPALADAKAKKRLDETIRRIAGVDSSAFRPNSDTWADMWDSLTEVAADESKQLMEASKAALARIGKHSN